MTIIWSRKPKIIENMVLMYQWERCTRVLYTQFPVIIENMVLIYQWERRKHILYTPFLLLYDYDLEWKTKNYGKYGSHVPMGKVYTYSVYTLPFTV